MVGYRPDGLALSQTEYAVAGALSGVVTRVVVQPLDVVKIRFQLQVEPLSRGAQSKYYGIGQACHCILREEGVLALWKGHVPAQVLSVIFGVAQFVTFELLTAAAALWMPSTLSPTNRPHTHFVCGGIAGTVATISSHPFDVLRTRLVAQGQTKVYTSMISAAGCMVRHEGVRSLYKGLFPTILAIGPQSGFQFSLYATLSQVWDWSMGTQAQRNAGAVQSFVCGMGAGVGAKIAVYPLDLAKKRLEIQGFSHGRQSLGRTDTYTGLTNCLRTVVQREGIPALYKGLTASLLKAAVASGCIFYSYEQCCQLMRLSHNFR